MKLEVTCEASAIEVGQHSECHPYGNQSSKTTKPTAAMEPPVGPRRQRKNDRGGPTVLTKPTVIAGDYPYRKQAW
jgi:hypothetical protein